MLNNTSTNTLNKQKPLNQQKSHKVRTFFASITGIIAVYLILSSITIVWLNRTLTNTTTYVDTVAPLITKPPVQNFIAQKVATQVLQNAPTQNLATSLLPASELNSSQTTSQLNALLQPVIEANVLDIIKSPNFALLWRNTNQSAHAALISQLNNNSSQITLDLSPAINGVISDLKTTQLSSVANKINISPTAGKLNIKSSGISQAHRYYKLFQEGTIAIIVATILAIGLTVWLSVHHTKTARRILLLTGIFTLIQAAILEAPQFVKIPGSDQVTQNAIKAIAEALLKNLQLASLIVGVVCIVAAISSKLYSKHRGNSSSQQSAPKKK